MASIDQVRGESAAVNEQSCCLALMVQVGYLMMDVMPFD